jgi:Flp pilus assembly protein TadG
MRALLRPLRLCPLPLALGLAFAPAAALADRSYTSEKQITHDCSKEGDVSINISGATAVFTGTCARISVNGSDNKVTIASVKKLKVNGAKNTIDVTSVDDISATGIGNTITYRKSLTGKKPEVKSPGVDNKITEGK